MFAAGHGSRPAWHTGGVAIHSPCEYGLFGAGDLHTSQPALPSVPHPPILSTSRSQRERRRRLQLAVFLENAFRKNSDVVAERPPARSSRSSRYCAQAPRVFGRCLGAWSRRGPSLSAPAVLREFDQVGDQTGGERPVADFDLIGRVPLHKRRRFPGNNGNSKMAQVRLGGLDLIYLCRFQVAPTSRLPARDTAAKRPKRAGAPPVQAEALLRKTTRAHYQRCRLRERPTL